jgi:hypothetical protein
MAALGQFAKRWQVQKPNKDKPRPMPVTNHFARTINAQANQLAGGKLRALCMRKR